MLVQGEFRELNSRCREFPVKDCGFPGPVRGGNPHAVRNLPPLCHYLIFASARRHQRHVNNGVARWLSGRASDLVKPKNRPGRGTQKLPYIPLQLSLINFLFTVPVQWPGMIDSAYSDFTVCIKGPNIGSF